MFRLGARRPCCRPFGCIVAGAFKQAIDGQLQAAAGLEAFRIDALRTDDRGVLRDVDGHVHRVGANGCLAVAVLRDIALEQQLIVGDELACEDRIVAIDVDGDVLADGVGLWIPRSRVSSSWNRS